MSSSSKEEERERDEEEEEEVLRCGVHTSKQLCRLTSLLFQHSIARLASFGQLDSSTVI